MSADRPTTEPRTAPWTESGRGAAFQLEVAVDEARALVREETPE